MSQKCSSVVKMANSLTISFLNFDKLTTLMGSKKIIVYSAKILNAKFVVKCCKTENKYE
jgi:hypothetical protein